MSNKIVPNIYRAVIDDVVQHIKPEFEEYGVEESVLAELISKWEAKIVASHVAEFDQANSQQAAAQAPAQPQIHQAYPPHPMHMMQTHPHYANPYAHMAAAAAPSQPHVKTEPLDNRYMLNPYASLPPLPGPNVAAARQPTQPAQAPTHAAPSYNTTTRLIQTNHYAPSTQNGARPAYAPQAAAHMQPGPSNGQQTHRIPQVDGTAYYSDDEESPSPPPSLLPRTNHPSLPMPIAAAPNPAPVDTEAINSDLDDSDTGDEDDGDEGGAGDSDIVFCTYDKVARVKNKWKCVLKDGMIHVNGKDYLFAKCTGEFEW